MRRKLTLNEFFAVSDDHRIATHPYFAGRLPRLSYNRVWEERGGWTIDETQFELPLLIQRRDLDEVGSKKRQMYRQRYALFEEISRAFPAKLSEAPRVSFDAT